MLQHAESRLLNAYQFGAKSALAAVNFSQLLSSGIKDPSHQQQQTSSLAQSPLNSEGSTSATPPFHLATAETNLEIPDEICVQSSVWSEFLNGASSSSFMGDNLDNTIPTSSASATTNNNSSWWSSRDQEQWNQVTTSSEGHATTTNVSMSELEGGDWSPAQLGCLPTPEVNEQLTNMTLDQNDFSSMNTASLVDPDISTTPNSWSSILMGSSGNEEEAGSAEGLQEALFSKSFMNRTSCTDMLAVAASESQPGMKRTEPWEFNPLKGSAAFEMEEMSKQQFNTDVWTSSMMNSRCGSAATGSNFSAFGASSQFVGIGKIKLEIEPQQFYNNISVQDTSFTKPNMQQMLGATGEVPSRWGAHSSRLPAMLSQVLPANSGTSSKAAANLFGPGMVMSRSFGNYNPKVESYKGAQQREQSSMSQHSSITSQHSYDRKDSHASKHMMEESREVSSTDPTKRGMSSEQHASEPFFKRPRIDQQQPQQSTSTTPTLPFKATTFVLQVRKEKLGERITALQQLVSPFGKTDTASVLLEAIGYIKFLHEQVQVLSTPYMKNPGASAAPPRSSEAVAMKGSSSWVSEPSKSKEGDEPRQDLRSRGLCLVPISCSLQVANDNGADFWAPNIGGSGK